MPRQKPSLTPPGSIPLPFFAVGGGNGARAVSVGVVVDLLVVVVVVLLVVAFDDVFLVDDFDCVFVGGGDDRIGDMRVDIRGDNFGSLLLTNYGLARLDVCDISS